MSDWSDCKKVLRSGGHVHGMRMLLMPTQDAEPAGSGTPGVTSNWGVSESSWLSVLVPLLAGAEEAAGGATAATAGGAEEPPETAAASTPSETEPTPPWGRVGGAGAA